MFVIESGNYCLIKRSLNIVLSAYLFSYGVWHVPNFSRSFILLWEMVVILEHPGQQHDDV